MITDIVIIIVSLYFSFYVRFDFNLSFYTYYKNIIYTALPFFLFIKLSVFSIFRIYNFTWRYVSIYDFFKLFNAIVLAELFLIVIIYFTIIPSQHIPLIKMSSFTGFPRSIIIIDGIITLLLMSNVRILKRLYIEIIKNKKFGKGKRTLIVGAGNTGEMILRDILRQPLLAFNVVGFVDDDKNKNGACLHGIK
ncbi:MAG: hypothetical protein L3V56_06830, partial [Candidatus Magnetoovum sp. WYHC-5]|nr:hypothetical protein [Candidatus Magnetoovum sp. WYHC-5]